MKKDYFQSRTGQIPTLKSLFAAFVLLFACQTISAQVDVTATAGTPVATYTTVKLAFDAINAGTHQGTIGMTLTADIADNTAAVLNASGAGAAVYTSILIQPSGARILTGDLAAALFDLNGADNVTINGLNSGGNSLTIANTSVLSTSGTSTIRFIGGATNNTITNCSLQGSATMAVATNGGVIYFATDAVTANGNDNNTISNNNIGPAGANLPTKAIYGNGSTSTTAIGNSGIVITNNDIHDFFGVTVTSSGIAALGGCNTWTISNNRLYQTGTRTWTTGATHRAIEVNSSTSTSGAQGYTLTGNIVGYASNTQTGTYTLTGSTGKFQGIVFNGITGGTVSTVSNNTVASVNLSGVTSSGTSTSSPFIGMLLQTGLVTSDNNAIGSQSATGSLTFSTTTTTASDVYGMYNFSSDDWIANSNNIGGISVVNAGASGTFLVYGMRANTSTTKVFNAAQNNVGGTVTNSIQLNATGTGSQVVGIQTPNAISTLTLNNIRNLATNIGTGVNVGASVIGIAFSSATPIQNVSQNNIYNLINTNAAAASVVTGIQFTGAATSVVQRNAIYDLVVSTNNGSAEVNGIKIGGGTAVFRNNMIRIGSGISNAVQINGFFELLGTNNVFYNSVYIDGAPIAGTANSFAFNGQQTVNTRSFRNNIFFNARNNSGATGKNYAVRVGGTTPNPGGLTIDNNVYFANGAGAVLGFFNSLDVANLVAWQAAVGQDVSSIEANPLFVSASNLNLQLGSPAIDVAANLGVANDFDGDSRPGLNAFFDIGADERDGIPAVVNDIQATAFINPANGGSKAQNVAFGPQASFTNNGTANQTNITVRYRIVDAGLTEVYNQTVVIPSLSTLNSTTVTFPNATLPLAGVYAIYARAELVGDTVLVNDEINGTLNILAPLSGTYTVGTAGNYTSLTNAGGIFDALNNLGATSNITINIISDLTGETGAVALNEIAGGYTTLIKPVGAPRLITGSSATSLIKLNAADGVTIDGALGAGTSRDLTIENTNAGTLIWVASTATNAALNTTVKNTNVLGNTLLTAQGIIVSGSTLGSAAEVSNSNLVITNNTFKKVQNAVFAIGNATTPDQNWVITDNIAGSALVSEKLSFRGLAVQNAQNFTVSGNQIFGITTSNTSTTSGILVGANSSNGNVFNNKISDIKNTNTGGYGCNGIYLNSSNVTANINVNNNFISDVAGYGWSAALVGDNGYGIFVGAGAGYNIDYNTVNMNTNQTLATSLPAAINIAVGVTAAGAVNLRNNIFVSSLTVPTERYVIYSAAPNTVFGTINNNDYFTTGANLGFLTSARATLADIQTGFGQNTASVNISPVFVSPTDLHLNDAALDNLGTPVVAVTTDIDGDPRSATTPDMGADEFTFLRVNQFDLVNGFKAYPNPVSNILNIEYTGELSNVTVYNLLGAQVFTKKVTATSTQIDMSGLNAGTYLVKVEANDVAKTIKVIKQ